MYKNGREFYIITPTLSHKIVKIQKNYKKSYQYTKSTNPRRKNQAIKIYTYMLEARKPSNTY